VLCSQFAVGTRLLLPLTQAVTNTCASL